MNKFFASLKSAYYFLEYLFFRLIAAFINCFSLTQVSHLADGLGLVLYRILKKRRRRMLENLRAAYPQKSQKEMESIAQASMQTVIKIAFEFIRIPKMIRNNEIRWETYVEPSVYEAKRLNKGMILVVSHFGNWEIMGLGAGVARLTPLQAIGRPVRNPYTYQYIKHLRKWVGVSSIDKDGAARGTIKHLKQNETVCILIDQRERQGGVKVNFFGRPALTTSLPAILSLKYDVPIVATFLLRKAPDQFFIKFLGPFPRIETGNFGADVVANTQQYVSRIEEEIRQSPGNWLWMHNRWRL